MSSRTASRLPVPSCERSGMVMTRTFDGLGILGDATTARSLLTRLPDKEKLSG
jgi:hypothetical protein